MLVEAHALVREALRTFLSATPGLTVVAECDAISSAVELARVRRPDVVLIDGRLLEDAGERALGALRHEVPDACVVVLTDRPSREISGDSGLQSDIIDCRLTRENGVKELCAKVSTALGARCASCLIRTYCPVAEVAIRLSRREREVAVRVAEGLSSKEIAAVLGIAVRTVNTYRESLARKLGASSPAVITRFVIESGLL
jgi:two-component system response regulator NreC